MTLRTSPPQLAYSSGEVSPLLWRRSDYQRFQTGLRTCNGFIPLRQGAFTRAPGTLYLGSTHENRPACLIGFEFAANDALVLELTANALRVWRYGVLVREGLDPTADPYVLATPFDWAAVQRLQFVQSADVIYMVDGAQPIQKLSRLALDSWTITPFVPDTGPFGLENDNEAITITASAATGDAITLTAGASYFTADHVGTLLRLEPEDFQDIPTWTQDTSLAADALVRNDGKTYRLTEAANTGFVPPIHDRGLARLGASGTAQWEYLDDGIGILRITAVTNGTTATAKVLRRLPAPIVTDGTYCWSEGAWSARQGWPSALEIHEQRLVFAATPSEPRTVWFSTAGDFSDFAPSVEPDEAFAYTISGDGTQNLIQWLRTGTRGLYIGALGDEYSTRSDTRTQAIGPTTARFGMDSQIGSANVRPITPDGSPIFVSRDRKRVFEIGYVFERDANQSVELSLPSDHITGDGVSQIVWQSAPLRAAWLRRDDGHLLILVHDNSESVLGWARQSLAGGAAVSIAVQPETGFDRVMACVARNFGAGVQHYIEMQAHAPVANPPLDAVFFLSAVRLTSEEPTLSWSAPHLAGAVAMVWSEGLKYDVTIAGDGSFTLPDPLSEVLVGLFDHTHEAETLPISASAADGNTLGRMQRLHQSGGLAVHETAQGFMQSVVRSLAEPDQVSTPPDRIVPLPVAAPVTQRFTGVIKTEVPSGHGKELSLRFTPFANAPMTITASVPRIQEAG